MKKITLSVAALAMAAAFTTGFVSCNGKKTETKAADTTAAKPAEEKKAEVAAAPAAESSSALSWTTTAPWVASAFGDLSGEENLTKVNFDVVEKDGKVTMHAGSFLPDPVTNVPDYKAYGKIAKAADGIVFYFQKLPANKDFTVKAKAKVLNLKNINGQVSFGVMIRDNVLMNTYSKTVNTNYVAAGPLKMDAMPEYNSSFVREDGELKETKNVKQAKPNEGDVIDVSITKKGNVYTTQFGADTAEYTIDLTAAEKDSVYAGIYVVRSANIEFSDISIN